MAGLMARTRSASGLQPPWCVEGNCVGCGGRADVAECAGRKDAGTASSPCQAQGDAMASKMLPVDSNALCLLCLQHACRRCHRAWLPWLCANKQPGCVQYKHGGRQHKHPASTGRLCWISPDPGRIEPQEQPGVGPGTTTAEVMFRESVSGHMLVPRVLVAVSQQMGCQLRLGSCWC